LPPCSTWFMFAFLDPLIFFFVRSSTHPLQLAILCYMSPVRIAAFSCFFPFLLPLRIRSVNPSPCGLTFFVPHVPVVETFFSFPLFSTTSASGFFLDNVSTCLTERGGRSLHECGAPSCLRHGSFDGSGASRFFTRFQKRWQARFFFFSFSSPPPGQPPYATLQRF